MIRVKAYRSNPPTNELPELQLSIEGLEDLEKFKWVLNRALNLASPEDQKNQEWLQLCDKLEQFISKEKE